MQHQPTLPPSAFRGLSYGFLFALLIGWPWLLGLRDLGASLFHILFR